jgi:hypothetical protein
MLMGDQMRSAWLEWLGGLCAKAPVLLVLDDLHYGDLPTVQLVDAALRSLPSASLVVLGLARPEVYDRFAKLWADRQLVELRPPASPVAPESGSPVRSSATGSSPPTSSGSSPAPTATPSASRS